MSVNSHMFFRHTCLTLSLKEVQCPFRSGALLKKAWGDHHILCINNFWRARRCLIPRKCGEWIVKVMKSWTVCISKSNFSHLCFVYKIYVVQVNIHMKPNLPELKCHCFKLYENMLYQFPQFSPGRDWITFLSFSCLPFHKNAWRELCWDKDCPYAVYKVLRQALDGLLFYKCFRKPYLFAPHANILSWSRKNNDINRIVEFQHFVGLFFCIWYEMFAHHDERIGVTERIFDSNQIFLLTTSMELWIKMLFLKAI